MNEPNMAPTDKADWLFKDAWFLYELVIQNVAHIEDEAAVNAALADDPLAKMLPDLGEAFEAHDKVHSDPSHAEQHLGKMIEHVHRASVVFTTQMESVPDHPYDPAREELPF